MRGFIDGGFRPKFIIIERSPADAVSDRSILEPLLGTRFSYRLLGVTPANNVWVRVGDADTREL